MLSFIKKHRLFFIIFSVGVILDQATKIIARAYLPGKKIIIIKNLFSFWLTFNEGAAWSFLSGHRVLLVAVSLIACILIGFYYFKMDNGRVAKIGLSMVFSGAFGNLIDRALFGKVTDFIDFNFFAIFNSKFPIFNIADIFVTVGAAVLLIGIIFFEKDNKVSEDE